MSTTLAQISARTAASLIKKLSGSDAAKFIKFGITSKGQPWIVYEVGDRKCSQFLSKKEWDFTKPEIFFVAEIRIASDTISPSATPYLSGLYSAVNLRKKTQHDVSYYRRNQDTPAITNCGCVAGQFKKNCKHQTLVKYLGDRHYDSILADYGKKSAPAPVANPTSSGYVHPAQADYGKKSAPAPVANPTSSGYVHPAQKEADRVWADNQYRAIGNTLKLDNDSIYLAGIIRRAGAAQTKYAIESASYGTFLINTEYVAQAVEKSAGKVEPVQPVVPVKKLSEPTQADLNRQVFDDIWNNKNQAFVEFNGRQAKRVPLIVVDLITTDTGYMIFETANGNFLVKKTASPSEAIATILPSPVETAPKNNVYGVSPKIAVAVREIRKNLTAQSQQREQRKQAVEIFPDVFTSAGSGQVVWSFAGGDTWVSSLGVECPSAQLEVNVRLDISSGREVICRTSKQDYLCIFSADGKIEKKPVARVV